MTRLHVLDLPADQMEGEALAVFFFEDERPPGGAAALVDWRLNGRLTRLLLSGEAVGRPGEYLVTDNNGKLGTPWILLAGGGRWAALDRDAYRDLVVDALQTCRRAGWSRVALCLAPFPGAGNETMRELVAGAMADLKDEHLECLLSVADKEPLRHPAHGD